MQAIEVLGYIAQAFFVIASLLQARKVYIEGHSDGLSYGLLLPLIVGFGIMLYYVPVKVGWDFVLLFGYVGQLACILFMLYYKVRPRRPMQVNLNGAPISAADIEEAALKAMGQATPEELWVWDEARGQYINANKDKK